MEKNDSEKILLTGRGPIFYKGLVRIPIEGDIELSKHELQQSLDEALIFKTWLDEAIDNMARLLKETNSC